VAEDGDGNLASMRQKREIANLLDISSIVCFSHGLPR